MKKIISILLTLVLLLAMAACSNDATDSTQAPEGKATEGTAGANQPSGSASEPGQAEAGFGLTFHDVKLVPGAAFDPAALPEAASVVQVPSCAFEGTDNAYNYEAFELTAYNEGNGEVIYSIYLLDPNTATDEGLYLGDTLSRAEELYGTEYVKKETQVTYTSGNTMLILILQGDNIASIEYRMAQ